MRRSRQVLMIALAAGVALAAPLTALRAGGREDAREALATGLAALDRGHPREARVELMNAIKADPNWAAARIVQARVFLALGDALAAQAELERARALGARSGTTRHLMAHAYILEGRPEDALREAHAPDVLPQQRAYAARMAGRAYEALGQEDAASRAFGAALALAPSDAAGWVDLARFRAASGDQAGALAAADRAVALAPRDVGALAARALLVRDQYGLVAALPWFERVLAIDPNYVPALSDYAATLADLGRARQALSLTRRVIALEPGNASAFFVQALVAARAGQGDLARRLLARTGGRLDDRPATMLLRGILYLDGGNATLAAEQLGQLVRRQPFNLRARQLLARAQYEDGQYAAMADTLSPVVEGGNGDSYSLTLAARGAERREDSEAAAALLSRASRATGGVDAAFPGEDSLAALAGAAMANPGAAGPNLPYIRALLRSGQGEAALERATGLRDANRGAPAAHMVVGDVLMALGRPEAAARAYEAAANLQYSEEVATRLVMAWARAGRTAEAARALSLYLSQNPSSIAANRLAASAWLEAGEWSRAVAALEAVRARCGDNDALLMADLARAWLGKGDTAKALAYAAHGYRLQPASPVTTDALGWALFKARGRNQDSVDLLEKAVALMPGHPLPREHLRIVMKG